MDAVPDGTADITPVDALGCGLCSSSIKEQTTLDLATTQLG